MPKHNGVAVSICDRNGKPMKEYEVEVSEYDIRDTGLGTSIPMVKCWIASQAKKVFKVRFEVDRQRVQGGVALRTTLDGSPILRNLLLESEDSIGFDEGMVEATKRVRRYMFEDIIVTDDESVVAPGSANPDVGLIELHFHAYQDRDDRVPAEDYPWNSALRDPRTGTSIMHEEDKKHPGHNVQFGQAVRASQSYLPRFIEVGAVVEIPFIIFKIRYRPEETLRRLCVIPRKKKRGMVERPSRRSKRLRRGGQPTCDDDEEEEGSVKNEPEDDQPPPVHSPSRSQLSHIPTDDGNPSQLEDIPPLNVPSIDHSPQNDAEREHPAHSGAPPSHSHVDSREPTLDYLDPPTADDNAHPQVAEAAVTLIDHAASSESVKVKDESVPPRSPPSVKRESEPDIMKIAERPSSRVVKQELEVVPAEQLPSVLHARVQHETGGSPTVTKTTSSAPAGHGPEGRKIKQERIAHIEDMIAELQREKDALIREQSTKREPSPLRVPVQGEVIDLT